MSSPSASGSPAAIMISAKYRNTAQAITEVGQQNERREKTVSTVQAIAHETNFEENGSGSVSDSGSGSGSVLVQPERNGQVSE